MCVAPRPLQGLACWLVSCRKRGVKGAAGQGSAGNAAPAKKAAAATPKRAAAKRAISLDSGDEDDNVIDLSSPRVSSPNCPASTCWVFLHARASMLCGVPCADSTTPVCSPRSRSGRSVQPPKSLQRRRRWVRAAMRTRIWKQRQARMSRTMRTSACDAAHAAAYPLQACARS